MTHDLISRQSAVDMVLEYAKRLHEPVGTPEDNEMYSYGRGLLLGIELNLKQLPSVETKKGKWVFKRLYHEADECICSECGQLMATAHEKRMRFCPNCGALMEVTE